MDQNESGPCHPNEKFFSVFGIWFEVLAHIHTLFRAESVARFLHLSYWNR
jgi:hypothetical protein